MHILQISLIRREKEKRKREGRRKRKRGEEKRKVRGEEEEKIFLYSKKNIKKMVKNDKIK